MLRKTLLSIAIASSGLAGTQMASAADLPVKAQPMVTAAPAWSWTGFYVGVNGGFGGDKTTHSFSSTFGLSGDRSITSSGFLAGGQVGYNWQFTNWVLGVEADIDWSNIESKLTVDASIPGGTLSVSTGTELNWFGTVRGRLGFVPWERALIYGTGGWAFANTTTHFNLAVGGLSVNSKQDNDKSGWTAGAGFEYAVLPNVSFKTEYLYIDLGTDRVGALPLQVEEHTKFHVVRAGLNWRFWSY